jgi:hypothetical protein
MRETAHGSAPSRKSESHATTALARGSVRMQSTSVRSSDVTGTPSTSVRSDGGSAV